MSDPLEAYDAACADYDANWRALDEDNKVSLAAKWIDPKSLDSEVVVLNKYEKAS